MKKKNVFIKVFGIVFLLSLIFLYLAIYFIPSIENINRRKRELKDMHFKIKNFLEMEKEFSHSNERERLFFNRLDEELGAQVPGVRSKEPFIALFTRVLDYIKNRARADGISNLVFTSDSRELQLNAAPLSTDKRSLKQLFNFAAVCLSDIKSKTAAARSPAPLLENLHYQTVYLAFSGNLPSAVNFINHIPWSDHYIRPDHITVSAGDMSAYYFVFLRVYFIDLSSGSGPSSQSADDIMIDFHSPMLLRRVCEEPMETYTRRELPREFGGGIFTAPRNR
jgi:hypothetical protein